MASRLMPNFKPSGASAIFLPTEPGPPLAGFSAPDFSAAAGTATRAETAKRGTATTVQDMSLIGILLNLPASRDNFTPGFVPGSRTIVIRTSGARCSSFSRVPRARPRCDATRPGSGTEALALHDPVHLLAPSCRGGAPRARPERLLRHAEASSGRRARALLARGGRALR